MAAGSHIRQKGFTLFELLLVIGVLAVLIVGSFPALRSLQRTADLTRNVQEVIQVLRVAQNRTLASEEAAQYGVYFDDSTDPQQYVLFQGTSYASRVSTYDEVYQIAAATEFSSFSLTGVGQEVLFDRIEGTTTATGSIIMAPKAEPSKTRTIYVENSGKIEVDASTSPNDTDRITDSRHTHVTYTRTIDISGTSTEKIVLTFSVATQDIIIKDNILGGQIFWEGDIIDGGETQHIKIHTHTLNDAVADTQFSIHRDRRFNTKPLTIDIDGSPDPDTGTFLVYDAGGVTTQGSSIFVSTPNLQ